MVDYWLGFVDAGFVNMTNNYYGMLLLSKMLLDISEWWNRYPTTVDRLETASYTVHQISLVYLVVIIIWLFRRLRGRFLALIYVLQNILWENCLWIATFKFVLNGCSVKMQDFILDLQCSSWNSKCAMSEVLHICPHLRVVPVHVRRYFHFWCHVMLWRRVQRRIRIFFTSHVS